MDESQVNYSLLDRDNMYLKYIKLPELQTYPEKKFKCKGVKHQYENHNGKFICTCGKTIE